MESYQISFTAAAGGGKKNLPATGDLFVYESANVATGAETRIKVKPANGNTIILKPGQWFRYPDKVTDWAMESYNGNDVIDAVFVIGLGEFGDANTLNKFTLDASFANNVNVTNTTANRVPVTLDPTQTLNVAGSIVAYTHTYSANTTSGAPAISMLGAATNVNGVILNTFELLAQPASTGFGFVVLAKAGSAPTNFADGDVLMAGGQMATGLAKHSLAQSVEGQIKVAAGKGIFYLSNQADNCVVRSALMTVL